MNPASQCDDKRISIDVALIQQELKDLNGVIRWIDGRAMLGDPLTKSTTGDFLRHVLLQGSGAFLRKECSYSRSFSSKLQTVPVWRPTLMIV